MIATQKKKRKKHQRKIIPSIPSVFVKYHFAWEDAMKPGLVD